MEAVCDLGLMGAPTDVCRTPSLFALLRRAIRPLLLSPRERELMKLIEFAAARLGEPLLGSTDQADLDVRLDAAIADPALEHTAVLMLGGVTPDLLSDVPSPDEWAADVARAYGAGCEAKLREGAHLAGASIDVVRRLFEAARGPEPDESVDVGRLRQSIESITSILRDPFLHPETTQLVIDSQKAIPCLLAVYQVAVFPGAGRQVPEPWLKLAIADRWVEGQRAGLRVLASLPGLGVPESVIPSSDRLDLVRIAREVDEDDEAFADFVQLARDSGQDVFPAEPDSRPVR